MLAAIILLVAALIFSLQFKPVQTYLAKKGAKYLSGELKTRVEVESLYIKPFKSLVLEGLYIEDLEKDTLLYSPKFTIDLNFLSLNQRKISVNTVQLDNGKIYLKQYKDTTTNLEFIINYFDTGTTKPRKKPRKPYDITFDNIVLNNIAFKYKNFNSDTVIKGINFNDIYLRNLNTTIKNLDTKNHLVKADFKNLNFHEKSGFYLKNLTTQATIDTNQMEFKNLLLETTNSRLSDYLLMKFDSFKDFGEFVSKVYLKADFNNTYLYSRDIAFFAPSLFKMDINLKIDGVVSGYVTDFRARDLSLKAGKATYVKGDFNVKGLPDIGQTFLDLRFEQAYTNKKDLDLIISKITGNKRSVVPPIADKFGNVNFKGRFTGLTDDFIAYGEFKTRLGRVVSDINMKISENGIPAYSGVVKAYDFNIGDLLNQKELGRTTLVANIKGSGFEINQLNEQIKADAAYFDFKGYRYRNIAVNGTFNKKLFDGQITVNDRNLGLSFNGGVNLNPALPEFNFTSTITGANLNALNLTKDTVQVDAQFSTNFTGNNLDNIEGSVDIRRVRLTNAKNSFVVDSVSLAAIGIGDNRSLTINSDILDASIRGQYNLQTLPSYFKTVVKKYVPSLQVNILPPQPQNFEFNLNLKYFEPLSLLLIPQLKIPEGAILNGRFVSSENVATLNGFSKLVEYNNIKIHNLIIDESTGADALNLFLTSDRVDLTENLYVQNVNISNILRNDSLSLNVKLSDKDAVNQLDLNGLIEFGVDTFARLSVLPSDVIINSENWRIQEQVSIKFDEGKTIIENFELFRDNQLLTINGIISADPQDELTVGFNQFKLTTFNPLTESLGISLRGELNGNFNLAAIGKTPRIEAALKVDSLSFNNTAIGDLVLAADFDNSTKLVNVNMDIINQGEKTLDIAGTYNANADFNTLDMDVRMRENEIIIFEPFLKKLVSNLKGKVSADLKVTGQLTNPQINGTLSLNDGGMTVNYLKTPYRITDDLIVENSVIKLDDLIIRDINDNEAVANGSVDMRNPNTPTINVTLVANNFMALNTTAKDNPLYYGTAFGTGVFSFKGPTDNMSINIDAKTEAGTVFNIPLNSSETVKENDFITFVAKDSTLNVKKETSFNGLTMNFDLVIDENSQVNIFTDLGQLSGRGDADLNLKITSLGDFEMFGDYLISQGKFEFTAQDFINKIFEISQGGSIRWTGNPTEALINLRAVYAVRASLQPLYVAAGRLNEAQRVLAEAIMNLSGNLLQPDITFDINFPENAYIKDELQSYFSDVNNVNQQALSLIVRRSFAPGTGTDLGKELNSTVLNAGYELAFNQLNNIISQSLDLNFVDFNIRSFNEASASLRLLNDRLLISGGVTDRRTNINDLDIIGSSIARDVEAQYLLRPDGSLLIRASNRLNNRNFLSPDEEYVSAIGLVYRQEFDNLNEFLRIIIGKNRREERQNKETPPAPETNALIPEKTKSPTKKP